MKLYEFLIDVLKAHGSTLQRLAALMGEEELLLILEKGAEMQEEKPSPFLASNLKITLDASHLATEKLPLSSAYAEIADAVHSLRLASFIEFHVWAYPYYRYLIENTEDLRCRIRNEHDFIQQAVEYAQYWIQNLPLTLEISRQAELATQASWVRFRTSVLLKGGHRPISQIK